MQDLSDRQEYEDVLVREQALIAGHADMEFSGFVTVTCPEPRRVVSRRIPDRTSCGPVDVRDPNPLRAPGARIRCLRLTVRSLGQMRVLSILPIVLRSTRCR